MKSCEDCGAEIHALANHTGHERWCEDCFDKGLTKDMDEHWQNYWAQDMATPAGERIFKLQREIDRLKSELEQAMAEIESRKLEAEHIAELYHEMRIEHDELFAEAEKLKLLSESYRAKLAKLVKAVEGIVYDFDPETESGPPVDPKHLNELMSPLKEARQALEK